MIECDKCGNALTWEYGSLQELAKMNKYCNECGSKIIGTLDFRKDILGEVEDDTTPTNV